MRFVLVLPLLLFLGSSVAGCGAPAALTCGVGPVVFDPDGDVVQGESDAGCARVERRAVHIEDQMCKACPFDPLRLVVHTEDIDVDVDADSGLTYEPSHHNWADAIEGDGARVRILYDAAHGSWDLEVTHVDDDAGDANDDALLLPVVGAR